MVSFGVAPALVMYEFALKDLGKWGWLAAFIYVAGAALRLARFNTNIKVVDKRFFQGMPSPAAGALMAGLVWLVVDNRLFVKSPYLPWIAFAFTVYAGITMVSNAPFWSGKAIALKKSVPFWAMIVVALLFVVAASDPPVMLFGFFVAYGLSGYLLAIWRKITGYEAPAAE